MSRQSNRARSFRACDSRRGQAAIRSAATRCAAFWLLMMPGYGCSQDVVTIKQANKYIQPYERSIAVVMPAAFVRGKDAKPTVRCARFGEAHRVPDDDVFAHIGTIQEAAGTAFLVGPRHVLTAGHVINESDIGTTHFIFDCIAIDPGAESIDLDPESIYTGKCVWYPRPQVIYGDLNDPGMPTLATVLDWALVELDRDVSDYEGVRRPRITKWTRAEEGDPLYIVGHPLGLPVQVANGTQLGYLGPDERLLMIDADLFDGNSGSPVFTADGGWVGMAVWGNRKYYWLPDFKFHFMKSRGAVGEVAITAKEISERLCLSRSGNVVAICPEKLN